MAGASRCSCSSTDAKPETCLGRTGVDRRLYVVGTIAKSARAWCAQTFGESTEAGGRGGHSGSVPLAFRSSAIARSVSDLSRRSRHQPRTRCAAVARREPWATVAPAPPTARRVRGAAGDASRRARTRSSYVTSSTPDTPSSSPSVAAANLPPLPPAAAATASCSASRRRLPAAAAAAAADAAAAAPGSHPPIKASST